MQFEGDRHSVVSRLVQKRTPSGGQFAECFVDDPHGSLRPRIDHLPGEPPRENRDTGSPHVCRRGDQFPDLVRSPSGSLPPIQTVRVKRSEHLSISGVHGQHLSLQITGQLGALQPQCSQPPDIVLAVRRRFGAWSSRGPGAPPGICTPRYPVRRTIPQSTPGFNGVLTKECPRKEGPGPLMLLM
ncbi:MAG: hypothetical protein CM1200mP2_13520 [Planctomycetaceae bacterium]|nr:MAG: hypothetical protein CM1200mP2_13520 [Planctomycetaceae bacterium]